MTESIRALAECLHDLGIETQANRCSTVDASLTNKTTGASGRTEVTVHSNWHSGDGPYFELDESIKSFGIKFTQFKPQFLVLGYTSATRTLTVADLAKTYEFALTF
jgi:hypothetical protein